MINPEKIKRVVIKVGTSTLTYDNRKPHFQHIERLVRNISDIKNSGRDVILVSSGAIAIGVSKLDMAEKPQGTPAKQAVAAVGQLTLMYTYDKFFAEYGQKVAQVLLTRDVFENEQRNQNAVNALNHILALSAIPIINENDTVAIEEIEFGDNDRLSASVAVMCEADLLIILSDIDGLYDGNPKASSDVKLIPVVKEVDDNLYEIASGTGSNRGTGGMVTKLDAVKVAAAAGIETFIANGSTPDILLDIINGTAKGTLFECEKDNL